VVDGPVSSAPEPNTLVFAGTECIPGYRQHIEEEVAEQCIDEDPEREMMTTTRWNLAAMSSPAAVAVAAGLALVLAGCGSTKTTSSSATTTPAASTPAATAAPAATTPATQPAPTTTIPPTTTTTPGRKVTGKTTTLGAGTFKGGSDVPTGLYNVTGGGGQSGNFIVQGTDTYDEILGSDGVPKVRAQISSGDTIQISGLATVIFTPVTTPLKTKHAAVTLFAGTFTVGQDIGAGRYVATPGAGQSGNFIVEAENVDEILGGSTADGGVPSVTTDLANGDIIDISGMSTVTMTPTS
jgi:hypothetical protein